MSVIGSSNVVAIVNPLSGAGANPNVAAQRVALLDARFSSASIAGEVHVTRRAGHAREIADAAVAQGASLVIAWGGDGTINEVGRALAGSPTVLGIIPAGSGNGFANELGIPHAPPAAIDVIFGGSDRAVDVGEIDGRPFFNIAGVGFDALVAQQFNECAQGQRGLWPYVRIGVTQAFRYRGIRYTVSLDEETIESEALLIAFANGREYGNRLRVAPHARLDDGVLEAVVVADRSPLSRLWTGRHLALGTAARASGLVLRSIHRARIDANEPILYHVDGEPGLGGRSLDVTIRPRALRVRVAKGAGT